LYSPKPSPEKITPVKRKIEEKEFEPQETNDCKKCHKYKAKKNKWKKKAEDFEQEMKDTLEKLHAAERENCTLKGKLEIMEKVYSSKN
jgi:hypothetical protein